MSRPFAELKEECRRLRRDERLQAKEIAQRLDLGSTTVQRWLADMPLTDGEKAAIYSKNAQTASLALKGYNATRGITDELKAECIRLRTREGWSIPRLAREKQLSKGTLAYWFRDVVLTEEQKAAIEMNRAPRTGKKLAVMPAVVMTAVQSAAHRRTHTSYIGYSSELGVRHRLASLQWLTFRPEIECASKTDIIAMPGLHCRSVARIQVKTLKWAAYGYPIIGLTKSGGRNGGYLRSRHYQISDFDLLVGYLPETNTCYVLNWDDIGDRKSAVSVKPEYAEAWHKLDALFSPEDMAGREAFWKSLASDTPDDQDDVE